MSNQAFTHQLVIRRDTRSGIVCVGWARDMPLERYLHIALVTETSRAGPLHAAADLYPLYEDACRQARALNHATLEKERARHVREGWLEVPLDLHDQKASRLADSVGSYQQSAMQALHRLTRNITEVWAACDDCRVCDVCARTPPRPMQAVEFQVWKHQVLMRLHETATTVVPGKLIVTHSGLWLKPEADEH